MEGRLISFEGPNALELQQLLFKMENGDFKHPSLIAHHPNDRQRVFLINIDETFINDDAERLRYRFLSLYVTYYNGRTPEGMWLLADNGQPPQAATEEDLQEIITYLTYPTDSSFLDDED
jgi:hypothetical protein